MKSRFTRPLPALLVVMAASLPLPAHAITCGALPASVCNANNDVIIQNLINYIANWITGIIGLVVVLIIIISGIQMISSAGNPDAIKAARGRLTNAVIGLLMLIALRVIVNLIIPNSNL